MQIAGINTLHALIGATAARRAIDKD